MLPVLLGKKVGMTQVFDDAGRVVPVTVVQAGPCTVLQVKTTERDGYDAVQLGFGEIKPHRSTLPLIGHAGKAGSTPKRFIREVRLTGPSDKQPGDVVSTEIFEEAGVRYVDVVGTTKGRGYSGVMRRHGFGGQPASHGTERKHRSPGSISGSAPLGLGRSVKKGKRMAGQYGTVRRTVRNQPLQQIDKDRGLLLIRGSIPGPSGSLVIVRKAKTKQ
jgi:large subunit ribosomal protein L3